MLDSLGVGLGKPLECSKGSTRRDGGELAGIDEWAKSDT